MDQLDIGPVSEVWQSGLETSCSNGQLQTTEGAELPKPNCSAHSFCKKPFPCCLVCSHALLRTLPAVLTGTPHEIQVLANVLNQNMQSWIVCNTLCIVRTSILKIY